MFKNNIKIALRFLTKTRFFTLLNIIGLSVGMAACLLIFYHVLYETGFDKHHKDVDQLYRLRYERTSDDGSAVRFASCCPPGGQWAVDHFPQIETMARLFQYKAVVSVDGSFFTEENMFLADPDLSDILTINFIKGNTALLSQPNSAVISRSTALRYFGTENAVGKSLRVDRDNVYEITGVYKDFPDNSHIRCDILLSFSNITALRGEDFMQAWGHTGVYTYLRLRPGTDATALETQINTQAREQEVIAYWIENFGLTVQFKLQPVQDIHLTSHYLQELKANGDSETVNTLFIIALFIILMAWINYINLSTARATSRARQVGIRKVIGATRWHLGIQFFLETVIINVVSVITALFLIALILPSFQQFTGMPSGYGLFARPWFWMALSVLFLGGILLSGSYPVILITSFRPEQAIKSKMSINNKGLNIRKGLLLAQFVVALVLITGTFAIVNQIRFMRNQKTGFAMQQTLVIQSPRVVQTDNKEALFESFKTRARAISGVNKAAFVSEVPGRQFYWDNGGIKRKGADDTENKNYMIVGVDYDFIDMFELELVAGRTFSREFPSDKDALVLNEKAVSWMGFSSPEEAVGSEVEYWNKFYPIIGVLKNYNQQTVKESYEPQIFRYYPTVSFGVFALQLEGNSVRNIVDQVHQLWLEAFPGNPFDTFFLDKYYNQQYQTDERFGKVIGLFSALAVLITCLGIMGLAAFSAAQRTKEVGIRKVLGASVPGIIFMFAREFVLLLGIAFLVAFPVAFYAIRTWLTGFASKMDMNIMLFMLPLVIVWAITLFTVASQALRTANANPVETLRYE